MLDLKLWRDLARMRGQALTIALVVAGGVAAFVAAMSTHDSLVRAQQRYYVEARFGHVFASLKRAPLALRDRILALPGVADAHARLAGAALLDMPQVPEPVRARLIGLEHAQQATINRLQLRRGRWIDPANGHEVMVSEGFARANRLEPGDRLQALVNGRRETLQVVGVALSPEFIFALPAGEAMVDDRRFGVIWMARRTLEGALDMEGAFNDLVLTLSHDAIEAKVIDQLDHLLAPWGGRGAHGRDEQLSHRFLSQEIRQQRVTATVMPAIFLGVAAFLLNVVLGRLVAAQRSQIAVLKAVGYGDLAVGLHYLKLAVLVVVAGGLLGVALGAWMGQAMADLYADFFRFPQLEFRVAPWLMAVAVGVALAAGILGAGATVRRMMRLPPAEGMRPAAPPAYRALRGGATGALRRLSPRTRMIGRNIVRQPLRAAMTVLGVALAVAVIVSGMFWQDAVEHVMHLQFALVQRGDVEVGFTDPVGPRALHALARLPGVEQVEGSRAVPVRLRAGHRSYRTGVFGLPSGGGLRRLLDGELREIAPPREGLLLTDHIGQVLRVRPGDTVEMEVLEGARAHRVVRVAALVADPIGAAGYMELAALNRLMGEGESYSAASLRLARADDAALHARLKAMPKVASVAVKRTALRNFEDTNARYLLVFTGILTAFAVVIAIGVVYNAARIALAERAWELASLRVMGFTRREVSGILLGELALEMVVAIPLGWLIGYGLAVGSTGLVDTDLFRIPAVVWPRTYAYAALAVAVAGVASALIVRRKVDRLDLVAVLKTRE